MIANQVGGRLRQHDLAAVRGPAQPGRTVDDGAEVVALAKFGLAGVDGDPDPQVDYLRPCFGQQRPLQSQCRGGGIAGPGEGAEGAVALTFVLDERAAVRGHHVGDDPVVAGQGPLHLPSVGLPESGRALHIGQHEGDRPTRQVGVPHFGIVRRTTASAAQKR